MFKHYIRIFVLSIAILSTFTTTTKAETNYASNVVVINFHSFFEEGEYPRLNNINVTPDNFKAILLALQNHGYNTVAEQDFYDFLNGNKNLPEKSIIITIDDGYESVYTNAFPILKELNMQAIFFPITSDVQKGSRFNAPMVTWEQLAEMAATPHITLGNHSHNLHWRANNLTGFEAILLESDINNKPLTLSRKDYITDDALFAEHLIQKNTGQSILSYSYPFGASDELSEQAIQSLGYKATYSTVLDTNTFGQGTYNISRVPTSMVSTPQSLLTTVNELYQSIPAFYTDKDLIVSSNTYLQQLELEVASQKDIMQQEINTTHFSFSIYKRVDGKRIYSHEAATTRVIPSTIEPIKITETFSDYPQKGEYSLKVTMVKKDRSKEHTWIDFIVN
ncbi:polysaccharide deacetylase family protein [Metalysinibacillus jejuensis]|uniref:polysaccharide deacetylase family protein n=1 Tax=Metalysinibacillus jejuensis TaxID=914327 RepID=UPI000D33F0B9|nr:polysaccharide deacetylase family protein [Metalysinibacillus jejuensis]